MASIPSLGPGIVAAAFLVAAPPAGRPGVRRGSAAAAGAEGRPTVLVVDDEESHRYLTRNALERVPDARAFAVEEASGAGEALEKVGRLAAAPVLILSDQRMPDMTGLELLKSIRARHPRAVVRFVLLSSSDPPQEAVDSLAQGADQFVVKPVDLGQFRQQIGGVVKAWLSSLKP